MSPEEEMLSLFFKNLNLYIKSNEKKMKKLKKKLLGLIIEQDFLKLLLELHNISNLILYHTKLK